MENSNEILTNEYGTYSLDGKTMLSITCRGKLVVPATVEDLALNAKGEHQIYRNQLTEVIFSEGCTKIGAGWTIDYYEVMDHDDTSLRIITLPSTIQEVAPNAFDDFSFLKKVFIPQGTKSHFQNILPKHLSEILYEVVPETPDGCVYSADGKILLRVPNDITECDVKNGCEIITSYTFADSHIEKITLPESLKEIQSYAFERCSKLEEINIPSSVNTIGSCAFYDCYKIKNISIPQGIKTIEYYTFHYCKGLQQVQLPQNLLAIESSAFESTDYLFDIDLPDTLQKLDSYAFRYSGICQIRIPGGVKEIESSVFYSCKNLHFLMLGEGVEKIEGFHECPKLEYAVLPSSLVEISEDIFEGNVPTFYVPVGCAEKYRKMLPNGAKIIEGEIPAEEKAKIEENIEQIKADAIKEIEEKQNNLLGLLGL